LIADRAPVGSTVLFSGYRDGSFIFAAAGARRTGATCGCCAPTSCC
jgi:hypothetical protein